jgi:replicative DNA helicase Mcm
MDIKKQIDEFQSFLEKNYIEKIHSSDRLTKRHIVIDFPLLIKHSPEIGDLMIEDPEEILKVGAIAVGMANPDLENKGIEIRIKGANKFTQKNIGSLRVEDVGKLITVRGLIKQKSDVRGQITSTTFECPACSSTMRVIQLDEKQWKTPSSCGCGRKGNFRLLTKDQINAYSMMIEEPLDVVDGRSKLKQLRILCRKGLSAERIEGLLNQGKNVEITGIHKEIQKRTAQGKLTSMTDWYLEANFITFLDDEFTKIKITEEDIKKMKEEAVTNKFIVEDLAESIFHDIYKYDQEKIGITLQMVGGIGIHDKEVRGNFHILLVGDPGSAKSAMLKIAQRFAPKCQYVVGVGVSAAGLTAAVVKDDLLGGFTLEAGALPLNNGGLLCIDELDKITDENKDALHEPLEQQTVSISKASIQATLLARTSVLAAANPKRGSYSNFDSIYKQINMADTLIDRFDLVYPIRESKLDNQDHRKIGMMIFGRGEKEKTEAEKKPPKYDTDYVKKHLIYAKKIKPTLPLDVRQHLADKYEKIKIARQEGGVLVTGRTANAIKRVIQAVAKIRLHDKITKDDADFGYDIVMYSMRQIGINPDSGEAQLVDMSTGKITTKKDLHARIARLVREKSKDDGKPVDYDYIRSILADAGFEDDHLLEEALSDMSTRGELYEPRRGAYLILK